MHISKKVLATSIILSSLALDTMAAVRINGGLQAGDVVYDVGGVADLLEGEVKIIGELTNIETANTSIKGHTTIGTVTDNKELEVNGESKLKGNTTIGTATDKKVLEVNGESKLNGNTTVTGETTLKGITSIEGETKITGTTTITGNSTVSGTFTTANAVVSGVNVSNRFTEINTRLDSAEAEIINTNSRVTQLNSRVDDVEKTSYRGIAIALAAQQQIPNVGAGQFAVFGGVGHYEGETAGALGLTSVFADGRTALSAAVGVAGSNEVGGRLGVSYVFGGK